MTKVRTPFTTESEARAVPDPSQERDPIWELDFPLLKNLVDRIHQKTTIHDERSPKYPGCFIWRGATGARGVGMISFQGKTQTVHVLAYKLWVGPLPEGHRVQRTCENQACWNPEHLEAKTQSQIRKRI